MKPGLGTCYFRTRILNTTFMHKSGGGFLVLVFFLKHRNTQIYIETFKPLSIMLNLTTLMLALFTSGFALEADILEDGRSFLVFFAEV